MLKPGDHFEEKISFNYQDMVTFLDIVKDINPVHRYIPQEVKEGTKRKLTVQGMFAVCMFSGILSRFFPDSVNVSRTATFVRPLWLDEEYTLSLKIRSIDREQRIGTLKGAIKNSKGKVCIDCTTDIKNEKLFGPADDNSSERHES